MTTEKIVTGSGTIIQKLIADEGMVLTDGEAFGVAVYLPDGDSDCGFYQITREEYEAILSSQEEVS